MSHFGAAPVRRDTSGHATAEITATSFHASPVGGGILIGRDHRGELLRAVITPQALPRDPNPGETWRVTGEQREHADYGRQLHAEVALPLLPSGRTFVRFLATNPRFPGIGWKTANRLWGAWANGSTTSWPPGTPPRSPGSSARNSPSASSRGSACWLTRSRCSAGSTGMASRPGPPRPRRLFGVGARCPASRPTPIPWHSWSRGASWMHGPFASASRWTTPGACWLRSRKRSPALPDGPHVGDAGGTAISVHKSQGSAFRKVIVPVARSRLLDRTLIYTAVTRAVDTCVLVGDPALVRAAVQAEPRALSWRCCLDFDVPMERMDP